MKKVTNTSFNPSGLEAIHLIKEAANEFAQVVYENAPEGRRRSIALTNIETASMYAVKAAAVGDE